MAQHVTLDTITSVIPLILHRYETVPPVFDQYKWVELSNSGVWSVSFDAFRRLEELCPIDLEEKHKVILSVWAKIS